MSSSSLHVAFLQRHVFSTSNRISMILRRNTNSLPLLPSLSSCRRRYIHLASRSIECHDVLHNNGINSVVGDDISFHHQQQQHGCRRGYHRFTPLLMNNSSNDGDDDVGKSSKEDDDDDGSNNNGYGYNDDDDDNDDDDNDTNYSDDDNDDDDENDDDVDDDNDDNNITTNSMNVKNNNGNIYNNDEAIAKYRVSNPESLVRRKRRLSKLENRIEKWEHRVRLQQQQPQQQGYDPMRVVENVKRAAIFNQGQYLNSQNEIVRRIGNNSNKNNSNKTSPQKVKRNKELWDINFVSSTVDDYVRHLHHIRKALVVEEERKEVMKIKAELLKLDNNAGGIDNDTTTNNMENIINDNNISILTDTKTITLLSSETTSLALRSLLRLNVHTTILSRRVRDVERLLGSIAHTPLTDTLSYNLVEANGKAGNVGRVLALLHLRGKRGYTPVHVPRKGGSHIDKNHQEGRRDEGYHRPSEFVWALTALRSSTLALREAGGRTDLHRRRNNRNNNNNNSTNHHNTNNNNMNTIHFNEDNGRTRSSKHHHRNSYHSQHQHQHQQQQQQQQQQDHTQHQHQHPLDNPTRWLDAILLNMHERKIPLTTDIASLMLSCYACTGRTGRATHYHYKVVRHPVGQDGAYYGNWQDRANAIGHKSHVNNDTNDNDKSKDNGIMLEDSSNNHTNNITTKENVVEPHKIIPPHILDQMPKHHGLRTMIRMRMNDAPPPYKIPSEARMRGGTMMMNTTSKSSNNSNIMGTVSASSSSIFSSSSSSPSRKRGSNGSGGQSDNHGEDNRRERRKRENDKTVNDHFVGSVGIGAASGGGGRGKYGSGDGRMEIRERDREWSLPLTAAFAFADSLTHGACGHDPVPLNVACWNVLIKACTHRGALHRAMEILDDVMPSKSVTPDTYSYNTVMAGLSRVGDRDTLRGYLTQMTNIGMTPDKYTVEALVDGYLNAGDVGGAITIVQDLFNQHHVLPPYTTHLKLLEFALACELPHEARRHAYFLRQIWSWEDLVAISPSSSGSSILVPLNDTNRSFRRLMHLTKKNPKLSYKEVQNLFAYFGEELSEEGLF